MFIHHIIKMEVKEFTELSMLFLRYLEDCKLITLIKTEEVTIKSLKKLFKEAEDKKK